MPPVGVGTPIQRFETHLHSSVWTPADGRSACRSGAAVHATSSIQQTDRLKRGSSSRRVRPELPSESLFMIF